jgi:hypothetical protein
LEDPKTLFYVSIVDRLYAARRSGHVQAALLDELRGSGDILANMGKKGEWVVG